MNKSETGGTEHSPYPTTNSIIESVSHRGRVANTIRMHGSPMTENKDKSFWKSMIFALLCPLSRSIIQYIDNDDDDSF